MTTLDALQATLAAEHRLLHLYGVLGARTSQAETPELFDSLGECYREHRGRRDVLRGFVRAAGTDPVAAAASYDAPATWAGAEEIRGAASALEQSSAEAMAALVAQSAGDQRAWALGSMVWSATRQVLLGSAPTAWPGAPEMAATPTD